jgi:hypothetical protein
VSTGRVWRREVIVLESEDLSWRARLLSRRARVWSDGGHGGEARGEGDGGGAEAGGAAAAAAEDGNVHAAARGRGAEGGDAAAGRRDRAAGDGRGGAGDEGDARAGVLRGVRGVREDGQGAAGGHGQYSAEQGVPEGRAGYSRGRWCEFPQCAVAEGAGLVCLARALLQPAGTQDAPRQCQHCGNSGEHGGGVLWS